MKGLKRAAWVALAVAAFLAAAEAAWFAYVLTRPTPPLVADVLAVYGGRMVRYECGWDLERRGQFKYLVFSDAGVDFVAQMQRQHGPPLHARILIESKAATTAQNARYVAALVRAHAGTSILVVSSWWHLPRALLLTHMALFADGVQIKGWAADAPVGSMCKDPKLWAEGVRLWGSLLTYGWNRRPEARWGGLLED